MQKFQINVALQFFEKFAYAKTYGETIFLKIYKKRGVLFKETILQIRLNI